VLFLSIYVVQAIVTRVIAKPRRKLCIFRGVKGI
jgi:hypothetical protein